MEEIEEKKYKKGIALVVGINNYENASKLNNAIFDANSIANSFEKLSFYTFKYNDIDIDTFDDAISGFVEKLNNFDVGVFYFAGHGIEIDGKNYLLATNTPCDKADATKRYSMELQHIVNEMDKTSCKTKILIIDACRNNPFANGRGFGTINLAPLFAPQGTIIAYSTSPGQTAMDGGMGKNSFYTGALLQHIEELGLPIETFFKKVRTSVHNLSEGKQTSWEHTSLIGDFSFNSGQLIHSLNIPYSIDVVVDKDYDVNKDSQLAPIINGFKSHTYDKQNAALQLFERIPPSELTPNQLFIIGRNILQSAEGGAYKCQGFIKEQQRIAQYSIENNNHLLNGIFFEIYFDKESNLRNRVKSSNFLSTIFEYHSNPTLQCSFEFINKVLMPFEHRYFQIPSVQMNSVSLDIIMHKELYKEPFDNEESYCYVIQSIKKDTKELLLSEQDSINEFDPYNYICDSPHEFSAIESLKDWLSCFFEFPAKYINIVSNIPNPELKILLRNRLSI